MNPKIQLVVMLLASLVVCIAAEGQRFGGPSEIQEPDDNIKELIEKIHPQLERSLGESVGTLEPVSYRKQLVNGVNYFVKVHIPESSGPVTHIDMKIYTSFDGRTELIKYQAGSENREELNYF